MKIILSRKGFDSGYGGYPSVIMPNGDMITIPIPADDYYKYSDIKLKDGSSLYSLMKKLRNDIKDKKE